MSPLNSPTFFFVCTFIVYASCQVGVTSVHRWIADDSRIPKKPLILLKKQLFMCKLKNEALTGLSIANSNLSKSAFSVGYLHKVRSLEFSFEAPGEPVCSRCLEILVICNSRNPNLSFQIQVLRSCGWELGRDNALRTEKMNHCRFYSL